MRTIGAHEAKTHLPRLLDEVERGNTVVITRYGRPIARIVPYDEAECSDRNAAVDAMIAYRKDAPPLEGVSAQELIQLGRRY